jgi:hypothetical protein
VQSKNESHVKQGEQKTTVLFKWRGKAEFFLSREKKIRKVPIYMGGVSESL